MVVVEATRGEDGEGRQQRQDLLSQDGSQRLGRVGRVGHDGGHGVELGGNQLFQGVSPCWEAPRSAVQVPWCPPGKTAFLAILPTKRWRHPPQQPALP